MVTELVSLDADLRQSLHSLPVAEVYQNLATQPQGLTQIEATARL